MFNNVLFAIAIFSIGSTIVTIANDIRKLKQKGQANLIGIIRFYKNLEKGQLK